MVCTRSFIFEPKTYVIHHEIMPLVSTEASKFLSLMCAPRPYVIPGAELSPADNISTTSYRWKWFYILWQTKLSTKKKRSLLYICKHASVRLSYVALAPLFNIFYRLYSAKDSRDAPQDWKKKPAVQTHTISNLRHDFFHLLLKRFTYHLTFDVQNCRSNRRGHIDRDWEFDSHDGIHKYI